MKIKYLLTYLFLAGLLSCTDTLGGLLTSVRDVSLPERIYLEAADTLVLHPEFTPSSATNKAVRWESEDPSVVQISQDGKINPVSEGASWVTVITDDGGKSARTLVTITDTTWITGTVYAPNGTTPVPHALVSVPSGPILPLSPGVTSLTPAQYPDAGTRTFTYTDSQGKFTLKKVPSGTSIPLVIQLGKWRRQIVLAEILAKQNNIISGSTLSLPKNKSEGDLPQIAVVTGIVDNPESHLRRLGIEDAEFSNPNGNGRIHFYKNRVAPGAVINGATPSDISLWASQAAANRYDLIIIACNASAMNPTTQEKVVFSNYVFAGGRIYTSHRGKGWLIGNGIFNSPVVWEPAGKANPPDQPAQILQTNLRNSTLALWLQAVSPGIAQGLVPLRNLRQDFGLRPGSNINLFLQVRNPSSIPTGFTFGTPDPQAPASSGGRITYVDFENNGNFGGITFPAECPGINTVITPQEYLSMGLILQILDPFEI